MRLDGQLARDASTDELTAPERVPEVAELRRLNRLYCTLSRVNRAIVHTRDADLLVQRVCDAAVEAGDFRMGWFGKVDPDTGVLRPVAWAGLVDGYLDRLAISPSDVAAGRSVAGASVREGVAAICNDIASDERMAPWRTEALARGYRSVVTAPVRVGGSIVGCLALYGAEPGFFRTEEVELVEEIAADVSFGLEKLQVERDRAAAEERRRNSEGKYLALADLLPQTVFECDTQGRFTFANAAAFETFGYVREDLDRDLTVFDMLAPEESERARANFAALLGGSRHGASEYLARRKDGSVFPVIISSAPFSEGQAGARGIVLDMSVQKRTEEQLRASVEDLSRSNSELEHFAYVASHDLQEPLRMVISFMQLLRQRYRNRLDEDADQFIDFAVEGAERMKTLVDDLLAYSRVHRREKPFRRIDVCVVVEQALENLRVKTEESGARIAVGPLPAVVADPGQLVQLFQNLMDNAIKFAADGPAAVEIYASRREGEWVFSVRDRGIGIEAAHHERIFEMFNRLHARRRYPGTGLGLTICKKIVERHGGRIWVESAPGEGSAFHFTIPDRTP